MRKFFTVGLPVFVMIAVALVCIGIYMFFTNKLPNLNDKKEIVVQNEDNIILSKNELPRLDAAVNLQPLMTAVAKNFTQDSSVSDSTFNYSDTDEAYKKIINGEVDIVFGTYPTDDIIAMAKSRGIEFDIIPIAKEGLVFFVNSANPIDSLHISDIQAIYNGQVLNWSQFGGEDAKIKAIQKNDNSLTQKAMISLVMDNLKMIEPSIDTIYDKTFGEINDVISNYDNSENSIGYSFYYDAQVMYDFDEKIDNTVKLIKINDIEPNYENIHNGIYPLYTNYYLVKNKESNYENVQLFVNSMNSERGKEVVKEAGYIDD